MSFHFIDSVFEAWSFFFFLASPIYHFLLSMMIVVLVSYLRLLCQIQGQEGLFRCFFSKSFIGLAITFKFLFLIYFELFLYMSEIGLQLYAFACGYQVILTPFVEKTILSPH